jgi:hypothetical protein
MHNDLMTRDKNKTFISNKQQVLSNISFFKFCFGGKKLVFRLGQGLPWQKIFLNPSIHPLGWHAKFYHKRFLPNCWAIASYHSSSYPLLMAQQPLVGQGLLVIDASWSHSDTPHLVELLWTSDPHDAATLTWQHTTLKTDRPPCPGRIRTYNSSKRAASDLRLRPRSHCDRLHHYRVRFIDSVVEYSSLTNTSVRSTDQAYHCQLTFLKGRCEIE